MSEKTYWEQVRGHLIRAIWICTAQGKPILADAIRIKIWDLRLNPPRLPTDLKDPRECARGIVEDLATWAAV